MTVVEAVNQGGVLLGAEVLGFPATGTETAAGRGVGGVGDVALKDDALAGGAGVGIGDRNG